MEDLLRRIKLLRNHLVSNFDCAEDWVLEPYNRWGVPCLYLLTDTGGMSCACNRATIEAMGFSPLGLLRERGKQALLDRFNVVVAQLEEHVVPAQVAELADAPVSKADASGHVGSSPTLGKDMTPWPSGEAPACKAVDASSILAGVLEGAVAQTG